METTMIEFSPAIEVVKDGLSYTIYGVEGDQVLYIEADPRYRLLHPKQMSFEDARTLIHEGTSSSLTAEQAQLLQVVQPREVFANQYGNTFVVVRTCGNKARIYWRDSDHYDDAHIPFLFQGRYTRLKSISEEERQRLLTEDPKA